MNAFTLMASHTNPACTLNPEMYNNTLKSDISQIELKLRVAESMKGTQKVCMCENLCDWKFG